MRPVRTLLIALLVLLIPATPALAADSSRAIQMSWDGSAYSDTTIESFVGFPVTVPGDSTSRTLTVRNDGPSDGTLRVSIVNVDLLRTPSADEFYDDLRVTWNRGSASISDLDSAGTTRVMEISLAKGATTPVTIGYDFPVESTTGNRSNVGARQGSFDVLLELGGDDAEADAGADSTAGADPTAESNSTAESDSSAESNSSAESDSTAESDSNADTEATAASTAAASDSSATSAGTGADAESNADAVIHGGASANGAGGVGSGDLPRTGGAMWWLAVVGAILAGVGAALVRTVRCRD